MGDFGTSKHSRSQSDATNTERGVSRSPPLPPSSAVRGDGTQENSPEDVVVARHYETTTRSSANTVGDGGRRSTLTSSSSQFLLLTSSDSQLCGSSGRRQVNDETTGKLSSMRASFASRSCSAAIGDLYSTPGSVSTRASTSAVTTTSLKQSDNNVVALDSRELRQQQKLLQGATADEKNGGNEALSSRVQPPPEHISSHHEDAASLSVVTSCNQSKNAPTMALGNLQPCRLENLSAASKKAQADGDETFTDHYHHQLQQQQQTMSSSSKLQTLAGQTQYAVQPLPTPTPHQEATPGAYATPGRAPFSNSLIYSSPPPPPTALPTLATTAASVPSPPPSRAATSHHQQQQQHNNDNSNRFTCSTASDDSPPDIIDPVTAVCVDHDDLEHKIREEIIQASSQADVIQIEEDKATIDTLLRQTRRRYAICGAVFAIVICFIVVFVLASRLEQDDNDNNSVESNNNSEKETPVAEEDIQYPNKPAEYSLEWSLASIRAGVLRCGVVGDPSWDSFVNEDLMEYLDSLKGDDDYGKGENTKETGGKLLMRLRRRLQKESAYDKEQPVADEYTDIWGKRDPMEVVFANLLPWEKEKLFDRAASGKEYDICRAVGAAIFGKGGEKKVYIAHAWDWHTSIYQEKLDMYVGTLALTVDNDMLVTERLKGFTFSAPYYYHGLRFAGSPADVTCAEALSLDNSGHSETIPDECSKIQICARETSLALDDNSILPGLGGVPSSQIVPVPAEDDIFAGLVNGTCQVIADYAVAVEEKNARLAGYSGDYIVGSGLVAKEPLTLETYDSIPQLSEFLNWILLALFAASQHGISQNNAQSFTQTNAFGEEYRDAFRNAIEAVGNMDDILSRDKEILANGIPPDNNLNGAALTPQPLGPGTNHGLDLREKTTVGDILDRGRLLCAVRVDRPGFADRYEGINGTDFKGMDIDLCKAVASALFDGDQSAVEFVEVESLADGYTMLSLGDVDVVAGAVWSFSDDSIASSSKTYGGIIFSQPYFYGSVDGDTLSTEANLCLATGTKDQHWASILQWALAAIIYAEANGITMETADSMPLVGSFGYEFPQFFQHVVATAGNYDELYENNLGWVLPRSGRNLLNRNPQNTVRGPSMYIPPGLVQLTI